MDRQKASDVSPSQPTGAPDSRDSAAPRHSPAAPVELFGKADWPRNPTTSWSQIAPAQRVAATAAAAFAKSVIAARNARLLTRAQLAEKAQLSPNTVGRVEAGQAWPDLRTMAALAEALGLPLTAVVGSPQSQSPAAPRTRADDWLNLGTAPEDARSLATVIDGVMQMIEAVMRRETGVRAEVESLRRRRQAALAKQAEVMQQNAARREALRRR